MTDKVQKIREEVEKKLEVMQYQVHRKDAYKELKGVLNYIDSLQEEPVNEELEEAADEYAPDFSNSIASKAAVNAIRDAFKAGAQWQKQKDSIPVSEEMEEAADNALSNVLNAHEIVNVRSCLEMFKYGAQWKEKEMQSTIELAEDHAYFAGRTKTIDEIKKTLLSEVLPCFMHGGEADEVVAKLDKVLNQNK